jgi:hypothetical protein
MILSDALQMVKAAVNKRNTKLFHGYDFIN